MHYIRRYHENHSRFTRKFVKRSNARTHAETKTAVIVLALEELIRKSKISDLKKFKGKIELDINLDEIRVRQ